MKIHEHGEGSYVRLFHKFHEDEYWETKILSDIEKDPQGHILCEPLIVNGVRGNLRNTSLVAEITEKESGRVYRYNLIKNGCIQYKGRYYYVLVSHDDVEPYNRRSEFRVEFLSLADIQVNAHTRVWQGHIRDISPQGVGLSIRKNTGFHCEVSDKVNISFMYNERLYRVSGTIVRCIDSPLNDEFFMVGVNLELTKADTAWLGFVSLQQRLALRARKDKL